MVKEKYIENIDKLRKEMGKCCRDSTHCQVDSEGFEMKKKKKNKVMDFLNSYKTVCFALVIVTVFVLGYHIYTIKNTNLYVFGGYNDDVTVLDGTIFIGYDINRFASPSIIINNDTKIKEYTIGYYVKNKPISVKSNTNSKDIDEVKLSSIINNTEFSFTEIHKNAEYFSKSNIKNIDKLTFKINAKGTKGEEINIELPLDITKIK